MTRATPEASERERENAVGESRFLRSGACRPIPITERAVQLKMARKIQCKRRSKKNLEGLYEVLAPGSNILKVSPTTPTIKDPGIAIVTLAPHTTVLTIHLWTHESQLRQNAPAERETLKTSSAHLHQLWRLSKILLHNNQRRQTIPLLSEKYHL